MATLKLIKIQTGDKEIDRIFRRENWKIVIAETGEIVKDIQNVNINMDVDSNEHFLTISVDRFEMEIEKMAKPLDNSENSV